jgi:isocitrate dehydrogenase kinase/phosphatase
LDSTLSPAPLTDSRLAALCSEQIGLSFVQYQSHFHELSKKARQRFLDRDWAGSYADAAERLHLYTVEMDKLIATIEALMGERLRDRRVWMATKAVYSWFIGQNPQWEIAETYFNTLTRRLFDTEGVEQSIEFVDTDFDAPPNATCQELVRRHEGAGLAELVRAALTDIESGGFAQADWENLEGYVQLAAERIQAELPGEGELTLEMVSTVFFRGRGAYLVGRLGTLPLTFCLRHPSERGIQLDAVLLGELDLSILFSYTRAYFRVAVECPYELVHQLRVLLPRKPLVDLYNSIGYHRHGKTELYRDFMGHLRRSNEQFMAAEGARGMVMLVFTVPDYDVVFKLIKDRFDYPKQVNRRDVLAKYRLVFEHDRAGRLVEAHEFEHLRIPRGRFEPALLETLLQETGETVRLEGEDVLINHVYIERRVRPLNLFLREAEEPLAVAAALDYGQAIKDLASSNIFAGDIFTKNFGVTRTGRVVFYDYDELCFLTDCNFRDMPQPMTEEQEMAAEPWYSVRDNDIFPEEFAKFLGLPDFAQAEFNRAHGDLFQPGYWRGVQARIRAGEIPEVFPYSAARRLTP